MTTPGGAGTQPTESRATPPVPAPPASIMGSGRSFTEERGEEVGMSRNTIGFAIAAIVVIVVIVFVFLIMR
jgi:hypothetical protein